MSLECSPNRLRYRQASQYLVNNSFHCGIQPKRVSQDAHLYMLLHKKILRKVVIEKRFEESINHFHKSPNPAFKGFKGKILHNLSGSFQKTVSQDDKKQFRIGYKKRSPTCQIADHINPINQLIQRRKVWVGGHNSSNRPNMMYNLTLYRKGFRRNEVKAHKACLKVVEDYARNKQQNNIFFSQAKQQRVKTII